MADLSFYVSPLSEEIRAEGREEGRAENILIVLGARRIDVAHATREKITTCTDSELSRQWLIRAVHATSAEEIFGSEELPCR
ncbi:hypothetical protein OOK43_18175 [[Kitasatospora] papulosa]|uniref:hypothetical protein n=1 Tax=Streptomyces TaxID=1883 RepID=UPI00224CD64D|nr:hypothetical protein [[Kitasatospora] papulosa]MCX4415195.1 hypothetical protein [[Kitasatospora] papulosa]WSK30796.1 hypothetical protein OG483_24215 [[Kitasatospora] papulosa]